MPFQDTLERDIHFAKHGIEFGAVNAIEYERMADTFMFSPMAIEVHECIRPTGQDRIRFGFITFRLGVACVTPQFIRTFHIVGLREVRRRRGSTGYFAWQCGRMYI
jgi:hypothetical protein